MTIARLLRNGQVLRIAEVDPVAKTVRFDLTDDPSPNVGDVFTVDTIGEPLTPVFVDFDPAPPFVAKCSGSRACVTITPPKLGDSEPDAEA